MADANSTKSTALNKLSRATDPIEIAQVIVEAMENVALQLTENCNDDADGIALCTALTSMSRDAQRRLSESLDLVMDARKLLEPTAEGAHHG